MMAAFLFFAPTWMFGQNADHPPRGQGYVFIGGGSHKMSPTVGFGGEGYFGKGVGLGAELGAAGFSAAPDSNALLGLGSFDASYHYFPRKVAGNAAPYVSGGYTIFFGHNAVINSGKKVYTNGFNVGGGVDYFATRHVGVRFDARYYGHGGLILHYTYPDINQFSFAAFRVALTFR
jgi:hypothetical protein